MKELTKDIALIIGVLLLLAVFPMSTAFYLFVNIAVFIAALVVAYEAYKLNKNGWVIIFALIAVAFNPIIDIGWSNPTWIIIDFVSAFLFLTAGFFIKKESKTKTFIKKLARKK